MKTFEMGCKKTP